MLNHRISRVSKHVPDSAGGRLVTLRGSTRKNGASSVFGMGCKLYVQQRTGLEAQPVSHLHGYQRRLGPKKEVR